MITPALEAMIQSNAAEADLVAVARENSQSLVLDGLRLVREGITAVEEIARVAQEV